MSSNDHIHFDEPQLSELSQTITRTSMLPELEVIASHSGSETTTLQGSTTDESENHENESAVQQRYANPSSYRFRRLASKTIVSFGPEDPENPHNWSNVCASPFLFYSTITLTWLLQGKKIFVVISGMMQVLNSTIGSSLPSGATKYIAADFNITDETKLVLPISLFLVGYVLGPLLYGPLSEQYGRRIPLLIGYGLFNIFVMACALAPSFNALLVFRLLNGMAASAPIAIITGTFSDVFDNPTVRGRTMAWYMSVCYFFLPWIHSRFLLTCVVHRRRPNHLPLHVRLHLNRQLALVLLARSDYRRRLIPTRHFLPGNLRAGLTQASCSQTAQGDWQQKHCCTHGSYAS